MSRPYRAVIAVLGALMIVWGIVAEIKNQLPIVATGSERIIVESGTAKDAIPSVDDPQYVTVKVADNYLSDNGYGIDVALGGEHRFFPHQILIWHQLANARFQGTSLLVSYDPLCGSSAVYDREVAGVTYDFGTSGKLWENNFLMYDRQTNSLWSQALGASIDGPLNGARLARVASKTMLWSEWKEAYPGGLVMSRSTGAIRDYTSNPYGDYAYNSDIYFPLSVLDTSKPIKEIVTGAMGETMYWFCWAALRGNETPTPFSEPMN